MNSFMSVEAFVGAIRIQQFVAGCSIWSHFTDQQLLSDQQQNVLLNWDMLLQVSECLFSAHPFIYLFICIEADPFVLCSLQKGIVDK